MPRKNGKKQNNTKRLKALESLVYKTIENKQVNYSNVNLNISSAGVNDNAFLKVKVGPDDGSQRGDTARIGNSITLMRQQYRLNFIGLNPDTVLNDRWNQIRCIIAEPLDGNQPLVLGDILEYDNYSLYGGLVFTSSYTTKTATNRRYKIHMDKSFELNATAKGATKIIKEDVHWKGGKEVEFAGPGTEEVPTNHNMSLLFISDSGSALHPQVSYSVRSTYKDS